MSSCNSPLLIYTISTIIATSAAIYHAIVTKQQFYSILIYLSTSKINVLILGNLVFWLILIVGNIISKLFLGKLSQDEISHVYDKAKFGITETALALTIFREELNLKLLGLFLILLVIKVFHWLSQLRVDNVCLNISIFYNYSDGASRRCINMEAFKINSIVRMANHCRFWISGNFHLYLIYE